MSRSTFGFDPNEPRDKDGKWTGDGMMSPGAGQKGSGGGVAHAAVNVAMRDSQAGRSSEAVAQLSSMRMAVQHDIDSKGMNPDVVEYAMMRVRPLKESSGGRDSDKWHQYEVTAAHVGRALQKHFEGFDRLGFLQRLGVTITPDDRNEFRRSSFKKTKILERAEIFSAGIWNRMSFTEVDLDSIVSAFSALGLGGRVPLKLGHEGDDARKHPESQYAMGWVQNIWREGKTLFGRFEIPESVFKLIEEGFLKNISIELLHDVKAGTRVIPYVLDAVALLGSDQPAVGILKDLQALTMSRRAFTSGGRVAFTRGTSTTQSRKSSMTPEEEAALRAQLATANATAEAIRTQFTASETQRKKDQATTRRREIKTMFDSAVQGKRVLPKRFEAFTKMYKTEDDARVTEVTDGDVESYISQFVEVDKAEILKGEKATGGDQKDESLKQFTGKPNHEVFAALAALDCVKNQGKVSNFKDLQEAGARVMRANPKLAQAYHNDPSGEFAG